MNLLRSCGRLIVGGFWGTSLPESVRQRLSQGQLGGVVVFRRNIEDLRQLHGLCAAATGAARGELLVGVDQEGGRVERIRRPGFTLPAARKLGALDLNKIENLALGLGLRLSTLGFNMDFAPVLDVDGGPDGSIIGDRSFSAMPERCAKLALAFARGLMRSGVAACGKHFPGHGGTQTDSHHQLPLVSESKAELEARELIPFRAAVEQKIPALMTAHVVYPALDPDRPATFSRPILEDCLRQSLGFEGVLFSDDLEMAAISATNGVPEAAVLAVASGCDAVLICHSEEGQVGALEALLREAEQSATFRARVLESEQRVVTLQALYPPKAAASFHLAQAELEKLDREGAAVGRLLSASGPPSFPSENSPDPTEKS